jgi:RHS repeat-associated protein
MIAAKAFDPVLGVDIHIVQPPGPVPPIPVPHPFIGMLMDPFDFAPIIGATVMINGLPRATAGTGGKCIPPHIPIGGVFVKPPANECDVFMGSATVIADGDPLSRLGMPALSCHCVGMPPIPRIKKKRRVMSMVLPTTTVLAVPMGMPVLVGGPPTVSMVALGMKAGMAALGKLFKKLRAVQKASRRMKAISDKIQNAAKKAMDKLGVPPSVQNRVSRALCSVTGHPVDVATGKVFTDAVDFECPGLVGFRWERVWFSTSTYAGPLGHGWHHSYDLALVEDQDVVAVRLEDGRSVAFPTPAPGEESFDRQERLTLRRDGHGFVLEDSSGLSYRFRPLVEGADVQRLTVVEDANGNRLRLRYDAWERLIEVIDAAGRRLRFESDDAGRITSILAPHPDDAEEVLRVVSYRYDEHDDLVEVRDALDQATVYEYSQHLLVRETDRVGVSFSFEYDRIGPDARCVRTWGNGGIYGRVLQYDPVLRQTSVTDTRGATTLYVWNDLGLVNVEIDAAGQVRRTEYDEYGAVLAAMNELGAAARLEYDERGRVVRSENFDGASRAFHYDSAGYVVEMVDENGAAWTRTVDARGNVTATTDPLGARTSYDLDERGLPQRIVDPMGGETKLTWDASGNMVGIADRAGAVTIAAYDRQGNLVRRRDAEGGEIHLHRDLLGRITTMIDAARREYRFRYDAEGNVVAATDASGRVRSFEYGPFGPGGRLVRAIEPNGDATAFHYDREGDLARVVDAAEREWIFERDSVGNVVAERDFIGRTVRHAYDAARRQVAITNAAGERSELLRDAAGRLIRRTLPDGTTETFTYDRSGRLLTAVNRAAEVEYQYDLRGRVVRERQNQHVIASTYDACGRRRERESPGKRRLQYAYDAEGRLQQLSYLGDALLHIRHDRVGREVGRRLPAGVETRRTYGPAGELVEQAASRGNDTLFRRRYVYDQTGAIAAIEDSRFGPTRLDHDANGRLVGMMYPEGRLLRYVYDAAGNNPAAPLRLAGAGTGAKSSGASVSAPLDASSSDTVHQNNGWTLRYDARGHLVAKQRADAAYQFRYDGAGRLSEVHAGGGRVVRFTYDALGRRLSKETGPTSHRYVWDGDALLSETVESPSSPAPSETEYVFGGLRPLVALRDKGAVLFECDHIGAPRLAIDTHGHPVWEGTLEGFGELRESVRETSVDFRYPGQQFDRETGLVYNRMRYYDPELGIYTQPDPIKLRGGSTQFNYVPSPARWIDPYGLEFEMVDPDDVNFTQRTIEGNDYQKMMEADKWDWEKSGPLRVMEVDGQLVSYDNRRLDAARGADNVEKVPVHRVDPDAVIEEWDAAEKKFKPMKGAKKTWREKFEARRHDVRNKGAGGIVPEKGVPQRPKKVGCKK